MKIAENVTLGEPVFLRNLVLTPVSAHDTNGFDPLTIEEILQSGKGRLEEIDTPDINEIEFENKSDRPVLFLDGEEVIGAMQNRIIANSHMVNAHLTENIPVVCVEEGRWDEIGGFKTGHCSYPHLRAVLLRSRYRKIDIQKTIWKEISRKLTVTKTQSATSSMHDIYENLNDEVARYIEGFSHLNHSTIGFIGSAGSSILGCDLFQNPRMYQKFEQKLIRSYALDAIEYRNRRGNRPEVRQFLDGVLNAFEKKRIRKGQNNVNIKGTGFLGQALLHDYQAVHISTFPV